MLDRILGGFLAASLLALGVVGYLYRGELRSNAQLAQSLAAAVQVNKDNEAERARERAELERVRAQANRLTTDLRTLNSAVATLKENLSDAAKNCPIPADDLRFLQCVLEPATAGCDQGRAPPAR